MNGSNPEPQSRCTESDKTRAGLHKPCGGNNARTAYHDAVRLEIDEDIKAATRNPIMIAGWPGMGNVGLAAVNYMRMALGARKFAHIDMSDELLPQSVKVKEGLVLHPDPTITRFYLSKSPSIIFVESKSQLAGPPAMSLMRGMIEFIHELGVGTIYTAAAFALPVSCRADPEIYGAANSTAMRDSLVPHSMQPLEEGEISGMNGVMLGSTNGYRLPAACLMATMPQYAATLPNPKSSRALVRFFARSVGLAIDTTAMDDDIKKMAPFMVEIEKRLQQVASLITDGEPDFLEEETTEKADQGKKTPEAAMRRIEALFDELSREKSKEKATRLKQELDRWNLYNLYEDRFLGLFKEFRKNEG